jgi:hypothetical protein
VRRVRFSLKKPAGRVGGTWCEGGVYPLGQWRALHPLWGHTEQRWMSISGSLKTVSTHIEWFGKALSTVAGASLKFSVMELTRIGRLLSGR